MNVKLVNPARLPTAAQCRSRSFGETCSCLMMCVYVFRSCSPFPFVCVCVSIISHVLSKIQELSKTPGVSACHLRPELFKNLKKKKCKQSFKPTNLDLKVSLFIFGKKQQTMNMYINLLNLIVTLLCGILLLGQYRCLCSALQSWGRRPGGWG